MRYEVTLESDAPLAIPIGYADYLTAAVYNLIWQADPEYARFLHDEGYVSPQAEGRDQAGSGRRYKPFTYSQLRVPGYRRRIDRDRGRITFSPGPITWLVTSPVVEFARSLAGGMLDAGYVQLGAATLPIETIQVQPQPEFAADVPARFTCLSPIVAARFRAAGDQEGLGQGTHYIRPMDEPEAFSDAVRKNLIAKYCSLYGHPPADDRFAMLFDPDYLARTNGGTKLTNFHGTQVVAAFAPFTAAGSAEMLTLGYEAGFGSRTAQGHGMVEVAR